MAWVISLKGGVEQRALMRHEDIRQTLKYGGKSKAETVRGANARVVEMLRKRA